MWYPGRSKGNPGTKIIRAAGNGDQRLFILPERRLVVTVFTGLCNRHDVKVGERILGHIQAALETTD